MRVLLRCASLAIIVLAVPCVHPEPNMRQLSGQEIRKYVIGHEVTDGAHWADRYRRDGTAEGHSLGRTCTGARTIEDDDLCLTCQRRHASTECFEVWMAGRQVEYRRGTAAVGSGVLRRRSE